MIVITIIIVISWAATTWLLIRRNRRNTGRLKFLSEAVAGGDFSFTFPEDDKRRTDQVTAESLNRIRDMLARARQETIDKERYYAQILENVRTGIVAYDEQGFVTQTNSAAATLFGLPVLTHIRQLDRVSNGLADLLLAAAAGDTRTLTLHNGDSTHQLSIQVSQSRIRDRNIRILVVNDIHNELDNKEIDSWISLTRVLTHEIMNSVSPITSLSESLRTLVPDTSSELYKGLDVIHSTGRGIEGFVESYRQFTHIPTPAPTLFYVRGMVERAVQLVHGVPEHTCIDFRWSVEPEDMLLHADENLVGRVLNNLLKNAVEAIGEGDNGWVEVRAFLNEREDVVIEVSNSGDPIPPEVEERIFIPFFTTKTDGSGIGLSISRQIMRLSGGTLTLRTIPNTTFVMTFGG
ncbi:MAG: GHKL domain-containing protein [Bacteroidales bacterium]|nr:GHKL domain-containing protein [Bacteroidales bacterium]